MATAEPNAMPQREAVSSPSSGSGSKKALDQLHSTPGKHVTSEAPGACLTSMLEPQAPATPSTSTPEPTPERSPVQPVGLEPPGSSKPPPSEQASPSGHHQARSVEVMPWATSSGKQQLDPAQASTQPPHSNEGGAAVTLGAGTSHGTASRSSIPSRRNMRRRSTGEADVMAAVAKLYAASGELLNPLPSERQRLAQLQLHQDDAPLPNQAPQGSQPSSPSSYVSPLERMLQAQSGLSSVRQRRGSSQPQVSAQALGTLPGQSGSRPERGYSRELEEEARRQTIIANLMPSAGFARSSQPGARSSSNLQAGRRSSIQVDSARALHVPSRASAAAGDPSDPMRHEVHGVGGHASGKGLDKGDRGERSGTGTGAAAASQTDDSVRARTRSNWRQQEERSATGGGAGSPHGHRSASGELIPGPTRGSPGEAHSPGASAQVRFDGSPGPSSTRPDAGQGGKPVGVGGSASNTRSARRMSQNAASSQRGVGGVGGVGGVDPSAARRRSRIFDVLPDLLPLLDGDHTSPQGHAASGKLLQQVKELRHDMEECQRENARLKERVEESERQLRQAQREAERLRTSLQQERQAGAFLSCLPFRRRSTAIHTQDSDDLDDLPVSSKLAGHS